MISSEEIQRRKPVWIVLSEIYLDTELDEKAIQRIVKVFLDSGYSLKQLKRINYNEVAPVVWINLWGVAGEWAGFNPEWLYRKILQKLEKKKTSSFLYRIFKWYIDGMTHQYWDKIEIELKNKT